MDQQMCSATIMRLSKVSAFQNRHCPRNTMPVNFYIILGLVAAKMIQVGKEDTLANIVLNLGNIFVVDVKVIYHL